MGEIEFGNTIEVPADQQPFMKQFSLLRDRTLQACKLQHEHVAFTTGSLGADSAEIVSFIDSDADVDNNDDDEFPYEVQLDASIATSSNFPALASRQEENKRQGLVLARHKKKARASS